MRINLIKQFNLKSNLTCNIYTEACNMLVIYTTAFFSLESLFILLCPGGILWISSDRDDQIFGGFEIFNIGIFQVGKFW